MRKKIGNNVWIQTLVYEALSSMKVLQKFLIFVLRSLSGKFVYTIYSFNRKRNAVKMNISWFAKTFHEQIDKFL